MPAQRQTLFLVRDELATAQRGNPVYERRRFEGKLAQTLSDASNSIRMEVGRVLRIVVAIELAPGADIDLLCLKAGHVAESAALREDEFVWIPVGGQPHPRRTGYPLRSAA